MHGAPLIGAAPGATLPSVAYPVTRETLIRYAGASGDFNVIHWNERVATGVGLPDVIAHGMWTMGASATVITDWAGDAGRVVEFGTRFTKPVVVPDDDDGAEVLAQLRNRYLPAERANAFTWLLYGHLIDERDGALGIVTTIPGDTALIAGAGSAWVFALNLLGDALRDAADPRSRAR